MSAWRGEYSYVLRSLVLKDFRIRYRNMSLGVAWSVLNPLVMMGVLTFVFTVVLPSSHRDNFPLFILCGLVPFNFFTISVSSATTSIVESAGLVKRTPVPRHVIPIASVLSNCVHLCVQLGLLLGLALATVGPNRNWLWLPAIWIPEIVFVCGLSLALSAIDVYVRDTRYAVDSANTLLLWLVPIFYDFTQIAPRFAFVYELNPVAAPVLAMRRIILDNQPPPGTLMWKLCLIAAISLAAGGFVFRRLQKRFYNLL